ncbi:MAG: hypothetical protein AAFP70_01380, partial [Calditrichota bacterium]
NKIIISGINIPGIDGNCNTIEFVGVEYRLAVCIRINSLLIINIFLQQCRSQFLEDIPSKNQGCLVDKSSPGGSAKLTQY